MDELEEESPRIRIVVGSEKLHFNSSLDSSEHIRTDPFLVSIDRRC